MTFIENLIRTEKANGYRADAKSEKYMFSKEGLLRSQRLLFRCAGPVLFPKTGKNVKKSLIPKKGVDVLKIVWYILGVPAMMVQIIQRKNSRGI